MNKWSARVAAYRERMRSEGFKCIEVWAHLEDADLIRAFANELREQRSKLNGEEAMRAAIFKGKQGSFEFHVQATETEFLFKVSGPAEHRLFARPRQPGEHLYEALEILKKEGYWFE